MILEEERLLHEDIERMQSAIADRLREDPKSVSTQDLYRASLTLQRTVIG
jgi:hypothetical protein